MGLNGDGLLVNSDGTQVVQIKSSGGSEPLISSSASGSDGLAPAFYSLTTGNLNLAFNNTQWDRWRNNTQGILLASAARTASATSPNQTNYNARGIQVILYVTAASGTGGLVVQIANRSIGGVVIQLNVNPTPITAVGKYMYEIYPGVSGTAPNVSQRTSGAIPRTWFVVVGHADSSSYTYSLECETIV